MDKMDIKEEKSVKQHLRLHKIKFTLIGIGAIVGAIIGYYLWFIDFL